MIEMKCNVCDLPECKNPIICEGTYDLFLLFTRPNHRLLVNFDEFKVECAKAHVSTEDILNGISKLFKEEEQMIGNLVKGWKIKWKAVQ